VLCTKLGLLSPTDALEREKRLAHRTTFDQWPEELVERVKVLDVILGLVGCIGNAAVQHAPLLERLGLGGIQHADDRLALGALYLLQEAAKRKQVDRTALVHTDGCGQPGRSHRRMSRLQ